MINTLTNGIIVSGGKHKYRIDKVLGAGGFGITYLSVRQTDNAIVALKEFYRSDICSREPDNSVSVPPTEEMKRTISEGIKNFLTEANRLNRLNINHPNMVKVYEAFRANGTAYYVMEYVEGINLLQYINNNGGAPLTQTQVRAVIQPVLQAVHMLHVNRITHLDIKHENIVLSEQEDGALRPVLIDFGLAKHYDRNGRPTSTMNTIACTNGFAPLEQYQGILKFTPQADVYALAATLLYLLTAKWPPRASEITEKVITDLLPPDVSDNMKSAIIKGMRVRASQRTPTVKAFALDLGIDVNDKIETATRLLSTGKVLKFKVGHPFKRTYKKAVLSENSKPTTYDLETLEYLPYVKNREKDFMLFKALLEDFELLDQYKASYNICMESIRRNQYVEFARLKITELMPKLKKAARKKQISSYLILIFGIVISILATIALIIIRINI